MNSFNINNTKREKNRIVYLINELLEDLSSQIPLNETIIVIIKNGEIEDYDYQNVEFESNDHKIYHEPIVLYQDEDFYISTIKETLFLFFHLTNQEIPYASAVLMAIRHILGISQLEFAKELGITKQAYFQMEKGNRPVSKNVIKKICLLDEFDEQDFKEKK